MKKDIFITGHNSFVGKHLIRTLKNKYKKYYNIYGIDAVKNKKKKNFFNISLTDKNLHNFIKRGSVVIHLAAISRDQDCEKFPFKALDSNIVGTINLLKASEKKKCEKIIFASSEWVYGSENKNNFYEHANIILSKINSKYALTKLIGEELINKFCKINNKIILRFGIIYGNRKKNLSAVESLVKNAVQNNIINIGNKKTSRNFIHIDDLVNGIITCIQSDNISGTYNLCGDQEVSLEKILLYTAKSLNKKITIKEKNLLANIRKPKNNKFKKHFKWRPLIEIDKGIKMYLEYLKIK